MNPRIRKYLQVLGILGVVCIIALFIAYRAWNRHEMLRATLFWGRLAPLPPSAQNVTVTKAGDILSRVFRASFTAPVADVDRWLRESPGTRTVTPERTLPTVRRFLIFSSNGANAEVTVDDLGEVWIDVYCD